MARLRGGSRIAVRLHAAASLSLSGVAARRNWTHPAPIWHYSR